MAPRRELPLFVVLLAPLISLCGCAGYPAPPIEVGHPIRTQSLAALPPEQAAAICWQQMNYTRVVIPASAGTAYWAAGSPGTPSEVAERVVGNRQVCRNAFTRIVIRFDPDIPPTAPPGEF